LGDNIVEYTEVTTENNQYPPLTSSRKGIFLQTKYFAGNQIASDDNTGYNIVPYGYFTYRHMSDDEIFHFNINDIVENGIVSTLYPVFTTDENLDSRYLQYQLNYGHEFAKFAILQKQGGSRTYMYLNKLKQLYLTMPKSVEEQKAISAFFMNLDHLITLHQRKLFLNFAKRNDWEQRKLDDVVEDYVERTMVENQYPVLTSSQRKGIVLQDEYFSGDKVSQSGNIGYFIIPRGYFAFRSRSDNDVFVFNRNDVVDMGIISYFYPVFKPRGVDSDFLLYRLNYGLENQIKINSEGTGQHVLSLKKFKNMIGLFPSYEEQKRIGTYFSQIDHLITLHRRAYYNKKGGLTNVHNDNQQHYAIL